MSDIDAMYRDATQQIDLICQMYDVCKVDRNVYVDCNTHAFDVALNTCACGKPECDESCTSMMMQRSEFDTRMEHPPISLGNLETALANNKLKKPRSYHDDDVMIGTPRGANPDMLSQRTQKSPSTVTDQKSKRRHVDGKEYVDGSDLGKKCTADTGQNGPNGQTGQMDANGKVLDVMPDWLAGLKRMKDKVSACCVCMYVFMHACMTRCLIGSRG
jgi:hypothetical protein